MSAQPFFTRSFFKSYVIYLMLVMPVLTADRFLVWPHSHGAAYGVVFAAVMFGQLAKDPIQRRIWK